MRRSCGALCLAVLFAIGWSSGAQATLADCQRLLSIRPGVTADAVAVQGDGCEFTGLEVVLGRYIGWRADTVTVSPVGPDTATNNTIPHALVLDAEGARYHAQLPSKIASYITSVMTRAFSVRLDYAIAAGASPGDPGTLHLNTFSLSGPAFGYFEGGAVITGFDVSMLSGSNPSGLAQLGLGSIDLRFDNAGAFEAFLFPPLAAALVGDAQDPEAVAKADRIKAEAFAGGLLKQAGASPQTLSAVVRFIASLPHPSGHFLLRAIFATPLTMTDASSLASSTPDAATLQKLAGIVCSYVP